LDSARPRLVTAFNDTDRASERHVPAVFSQGNVEKWGGHNSSFCKFRVSEFFNSRACYRPLSQARNPLSHEDVESHFKGELLKK
jgi:hypothetical protein